MRYRLEQDLGRGNCYRRREGEYPVPQILVSVQCRNTLRPKRDRPWPLLLLPPDDCMKKVQKKACNPTTEKDTVPYRTLWVPNNKHFDFQWSSVNPCTTTNLVDENTIFDDSCSLVRSWYMSFFIRELFCNVALFMYSRFCEQVGRRSAKQEHSCTYLIFCGSTYTQQTPTFSRRRACPRSQALRMNRMICSIKRASVHIHTMTF